MALRLSAVGLKLGSIGALLSLSHIAVLRSSCSRCSGVVLSACEYEYDCCERLSELD